MGYREDPTGLLDRNWGKYKEGLKILWGYVNHLTVHIIYLIWGLPQVRCDVFTSSLDSTKNILKAAL